MFWLDLTSNGIKRPQNFQLAPFNMFEVEEITLDQIIKMK